MVEKSGAKKKLSSFDYGDALTDCSLSSVTAGILPFMIGLVAIPASLKFLDRFVNTIPEIRVVVTCTGAVCISLYSCKIAKERCDAKLAEKYERA